MFGLVHLTQPSETIALNWGQFLMYVTAAHMLAAQPQWSYFVNTYLIGPVMWITDYCIGAVRQVNDIVRVETAKALLDFQVLGLTERQAQGWGLVLVLVLNIIGFIWTFPRPRVAVEQQ